ncbi:MAG: hypothetical protein QXQ90_06800 [Desulfurococcaceae archaeon]
MIQVSGEVVGESKRYFATMYLRRKRDVNPWHSDIVEGYFRWWIVYFSTTSRGVEEKLKQTVLGRDKFRELIRGGDTVLAVPAHDPEPYTWFAEKLGASVRFVEREVSVQGRGKTTVRVPVFEFPEDHQGHKHMLYSAVLATYRRKPYAAYKRIGEEIEQRGIWSDRLGIAVMDRFVDSRYDYMKRGLYWVLRIGKAFRVMYRYDR